MVVIERIMAMIFGGGGNVLRDTVEIFRENAENAAARDSAASRAALEQFAAEFDGRDHGFFDRLMDGLNRVPRPAMAIGTLGLFIAAMVDPVWFASRMEGIALVPEPLWWLLGAIVSFYFGARHQAKGQEFQKAVVRTVATQTIAAAAAKAPRVASRSGQTPKIKKQPGTNPALEEWKSKYGY